MRKVVFVSSARGSRPPQGLCVHSIASRPLRDPDAPHWISGKFSFSSLSRGRKLAHMDLPHYRYLWPHLLLNYSCSLFEVPLLVDVVSFHTKGLFYHLFFPREKNPECVTPESFISAGGNDRSYLIDRKNSRFHGYSNSIQILRRSKFW